MEKLNHRVEDWLFTRAEAPGTRKGYLRDIKQLQRFCKKRGKDFYGIVEEYRAARRQGYESELDFTESWQDLINAYSTYIKRAEKWAPLTQKNMLVAAKSFLSFHRIPIKVNLPRRAHVIYHNRDLTKEQLRQILGRASQRDRTIWLLMAESGLRAHTAIHIKYWMIKEDFEKGTVPMRIITPASEIKDHVGDRWSFIGEDGVKALREYLEPRMPLNDEDYVFESNKPGRVKGDQFSVASISTTFRRVVDDLKLEKDSPHRKFKHYRMHAGLRKYFFNNMIAPKEFRDFWMGHTISGSDEHYITREPEHHRKKYKKGYEQLRIYEGTPAIITEISQKLEKKDQEIQQLREEVEELKEMISFIEKKGLLKKSEVLAAVIEALKKEQSPEQ